MDPLDRVEYLRRAVAIAREIDDQPILATSLSALGTALEESRRFDDALVALDEGTVITASIPALAWQHGIMLADRAKALAGTGRLEEAAAEATRALDLLRREGDTNTEMQLLLAHGDTLTALGRTHEAAETWRRFLALAHSPEHARETQEYDFNIDGSEIIGGVKIKLAALTASQV